MPVVAHPGEDLGYDLFALEEVVLKPRATRAGADRDCRGSAASGDGRAVGAAGAGSVVDGGAGYCDDGRRDRCRVSGRDPGADDQPGRGAVELKAGEKIAQMIPVPVLTGLVQEVETLEVSARAEKGFGSSGR